MPIKIIADDKIPFLNGVLEPFAEVEYLPSGKIGKDNIKNADALLIRTRTRCDAGLLDKTRVKFIGTATIGYDHIDTRYCELNSIRWINAPGCNSGSVMQYVASALVTYAHDKNVSLNKRVLGVIGVGNVGKKIMKLSECLDMQVVLNDPPRSRVEGPCGFISLGGILRECDIITLHVPLNPGGEDKTHHLVDEDFLDKINTNALLINTCRGEVVDIGALKKALKNRKLKDAIIDVWEHEPRIDKELLEQSYIGTPHIAGYSADGKANGTKMVVQALSRYFNLGLDDWQPEDIPLPESYQLQYDGKNKTLSEVMYDLIRATYDVKSDNNRLRSDPGSFETQRETYPLRREFGVYKLQVRNVSDDTKKVLRKLGFNILSD